MAIGTQVWLNGKILPLESAKVSLLTHGLHYGTGVFEGIRTYKQKAGGGAVFRLREHMERMVDSLKILDLKCPYSLDELCRGAIEVTKANRFEECYIRPLGYIADGPLGVYPGENPPVSIAIMNWEWGKYLGDEGVNKGARLMTSSYIRPHVNSVMNKGKITGQYVTGVIAKKEAVRLGFDEAIMLDPDGYVAEGTGENIFIIKRGKVKTTPLTAILGGITRRTVMEHLEKQGSPVHEIRFTRDELWCADEVFMCGTAAEITPIREVDNRVIADGRPGPLTKKLMREYADMVRGTVPEYGREWLTPIR